MAPAKDYRGLTVWTEALALAESIYHATRKFPPDERFGLTSQLRRAAVSVPSCIAEGNARHSTRDYLRFLSMASGSLAEIETQFVLSARLGYLSVADVETLVRQAKVVQKLLQALKGALGKKADSLVPPFPVPRSRSSS